MTKICCSNSKGSESIEAVGAGGGGEMRVRLEGVELSVASSITVIVIPGQLRQ